MQLKYIQIVYLRKCQHKAKRCRFNPWCNCFIVVHSLLLLVSKCHQAGLAFCNRPVQSLFILFTYLDLISWTPLGV